jgi:predicted acetyltransferase
VTTVVLVAPSIDLLVGYASALAAGWSPDNERDVSAEQLETLRRDPEHFLRDLTDQTGTVTLADGRVVPRIPFRSFWIWDGDFCGTIGLRFQRGTENLPPQISGHIGYAIVPWKQGRGYATAALALVLPIARAEGLRRVLVTCDDDNEASKKVIVAKGGVFSGRGPHPRISGKVKLHYWIET